MKNIDRIQTNILKMINRYVGKKYIYILPLVYHDHEDHRNGNFWENKVADVLTSCNIPCFVTYANYQSTPEVPKGARKYEKSPTFIFFCEAWQSEELNCVIRILSARIEQQHYITIDLEKNVRIVELYKDHGVVEPCEVKELGKWAMKGYYSYLKQTHIVKYQLVDFDINPRHLPDNFIKLDHHELLYCIDESFKEFLSLDLLDKNLSLENYLSKAGLVNYKAIYESNMPEDNRLLEEYRVIDIKEIPKELRLQYAIKLVEKFPLDACLFEVEDNSYISIICKNDGFYYLQFNYEFSGYKTDEAYGRKQKSLIEYYLHSTFNLWPTMKYSIKYRSDYLSIIERNNVVY